MTKRDNTALKEEMKALFTQDTDFMRELLLQSVQKILDSEMVEFLGVDTHERSQNRTG